MIFNFFLFHHFYRLWDMGGLLFSVTPSWVLKQLIWTFSNRTRFLRMKANFNAIWWFSFASVLRVDCIVIALLCCKVVTSRLGRSGQTHSRAGSAASASGSAGSDEPEIIQWKRGNVLGKGAYGTVSLVLSSCTLKNIWKEKQMNLLCLIFTLTQRKQCMDLSVLCTTEKKDLLRLNG